jgi:hypothetical protein
MSLEEVTVNAGHEDLMEVDDNMSLIVDNPLGILDQQLRHHPIHLLNINCYLFKLLYFIIVYKTSPVT